MIKRNNTSRGITLIALVITIIVMLILVAVTITMAINGGLFEYAGKAAGDTQNAIDKEGDLGNGKIKIGDTWYNSIDEYLNKDKQKVETIPTTESYVGCYADFEGDGIIDGIIYADLAKGNTGDGQWYDSDGNYKIPTETGLKEYYVSKTDHVGTFGTEARDVITAIEGDGKDRFYVMALSDIDGQINGTYYLWYNSAYGNMNDYATATSEGFGTGKKNTEKMIEYWNKEVYGERDTGTYKDIWGQIQEQVNDGWFVPSKGEWSAFGEELGINGEFYAKSGLSDVYWSSSQQDETDAWDFFDYRGMSGDYVTSYFSVRLSKIF